MIEHAKTALDLAIAYLAKQQKNSGYFEGQLSSMTFPTCALAWVQIALGETPSIELTDWLIRRQRNDGTWSLDLSDRSNANATLFAKQILKQIADNSNDGRLFSALDRVPEIRYELGLIKLVAAYFGEIDWKKLSPPPITVPLIRTAQKIGKVIGRSIRRPKHLLPTADFFYSETFQNLFIAEQQTLVPVLLIIECRTRKRPKIIADLKKWMFDRRIGDGSWFRVNYITALAVIAMIELRKIEPQSELDHEIEKSVKFLERTQNPDGGCREALNLNVWDTTWSASVLAKVDRDRFTNVIENSAKWLIENRSSDGGWAFSGTAEIDTKNYELPRDGDDTALSVIALQKSDLPSAKSAIENGIKWLIDHQSTDGSWATYVPGEGDVGCVSITAHAIEALIADPKNHDAIQKAKRWLENEISPDGYWDDLWLAKRTYGTACAISALAKTGGSAVIYRAAEWLEKVQNADGGWGEDMFGDRIESTIEQTAWSTHALLIAKPKSSAIEKGLRFILENQKSDGSWEASCVGIYWEIIGGYADPIYASVFPILTLDEYIDRWEN